MKYEFKSGGKKVVRHLPYDPKEYGFALTEQKNCCLHFRRNKLLLRVKTATQILTLEEDGNNRPLLQLVFPPQSKEDFENKLSKWLFQQV